MTYQLFIGDRAYSSWSLRGWLLFRLFGIDCVLHTVGLYKGTLAADLARVAPARLVPAVLLPDGTPLGESLAIAETLAERHPEAGLWPSDSAARATARWLCAEMASGFAALRDACPMQLLCCYDGFQPSAAVLEDLSRLEALWRHAREISASGEGWLLGAPSAADVFFAPVAARIVGYGLPVSDDTLAYCRQWLCHPAFVEWRAAAMKEVTGENPYALDLEARPWPACPTGRVSE